MRISYVSLFRIKETQPRAFVEKVVMPLNLLYVII